MQMCTKGREGGSREAEEVRRESWRRVTVLCSPQAIRELLFWASPLSSLAANGQVVQIVGPPVSIFFLLFPTLYFVRI